MQLRLPAFRRRRHVAGLVDLNIAGVHRIDVFGAKTALDKSTDIRSRQVLGVVERALQCLLYRKVFDKGGNHAKADQRYDNHDCRYEEKAPYCQAALSSRVR